jgi:DNA modification methylase
MCWDKAQEFSGADFELAWTTLNSPSKTFRMSRVEAYGSTPRLHPTQKPEKLISWCLAQAPDAKSVLDPWAGSGTTLVAAKLRGLRAVGIEINEDYCKIAVERLRQGVLVPC